MNPCTGSGGPGIRSVPVSSHPRPLELCRTRVIRRSYPDGKLEG